MTFPNIHDKHAQTALFSPSDFLAYMRRQGRAPTSPAPRGVILCYTRRLMNHVLKTHVTTTWEHFQPAVHLLEDCNRQVGVVGQFGIGAPTAVTVAEELIAFGVQEFISVGTAGSLQKHVRVGNIVVCDRAVRDEGTSHHYLPAAKYAGADTSITTRIQDALCAAGVAFHVGASWTTDAPYRETVAEVKQYQAEGILAVEMEAAALFAVAQVRGVKLGSILTISDSLANLKWQPEFHSELTQDGLEAIYSAAVSVLATPPARPS